MNKYPCGLCHTTYLTLLQKGFYENEEEMFEHVKQVGRHLKPSRELMTAQKFDIWDMSF